MAKLIFSGSIKVEVQGSRALRLRERHLDCVEYSVIGFDDQVIIYDFREAGLRAIDEILSSGNASDFPEAINRLAYLTMYDLEDNEPMIIELRDGSLPVTHLLWIASGLEQEIPIYEYDVGLMQQIDEYRFAILMLLDIEHNGIQISAHSTSSSSPSTKPSISMSSSSGVLVGFS